MNISSSSLFHFTPKFEYLQGIVEAGFKFRPCTEELPLAGYRECIFAQFGVVQHTLRSLVVCFCDLPLSASQDHRAQYGQYAIALTKEWGMANGVTPIRYVHARSPDFTSETYNKVMDLPNYLRQHGHDIHRVFADVMAELGELDVPTEADFQNLPIGIKSVMAGVNGEFLSLVSHMQAIMPYVRTYEGEWTDRATNKQKHRVFYDEREWRASTQDGDGKLVFGFDDVRSLIVTSNDERKILAQQLIAAADRLGITDYTDVWGKIQVGENLYPDL